MFFYHLNPNRRGEWLDDYHVLRRLPRPDEMWCRSMPAPNNIFKLAIVDCETTGLDPEKHKAIEFAVGTLTIDADHGDVVEVTPPKSWLEDPAEDLSIEIERLTNITSDMLTGAGFFLPNAHRAAADVWAITCLLASFAPDGRAIAAHLVEAARRPSERLYATRAPFECKDVIKAAGYRWSPERRA